MLGSLSEDLVPAYFPYKTEVQKRGSCCHKKPMPVLNVYSGPFPFQNTVKLTGKQMLSS